MDTLYIGDIPSEYHYANYSNYYVDLYNTPTLQPNKTYTFYRVFLYDNLFQYYQSTTSTGSYTSTTLHDIPVDNKVTSRRDFGDICITFALFVLMGLWLFNLITSSIRKGGLLGGLF